MSFDLKLILLDFAEEYAKSPRRALHTLQAFLLDDLSCRARIECLKALAAKGDKDFSHLLPERRPADFSEEIRLIREVGTFRAIAEGRLKPERLEALIWDPDALWQAHLALTSNGEHAEPIHSEPAATKPALSGETKPVTAPAEAGFTTLALTRRLDDFQARLQPWLPILLEQVGLAGESPKSLLAFILDRIPGMQSRRFRDLLPGWLQEFAQARGRQKSFQPLRTDDWEKMIERGVVRFVLELEFPGEPEWAREFRRLALQEPLASSQDLLRIPLPERFSSPTAFPVFRRELLFQIKKEQEKALLLYELS